MKKRFPVALIASLVIANGSSVAFADSSSDSGSTPTSTSVASTKGKSKSTDPQRAAKDAKKAAQDEARAKYLAGLTKLRETRDTINTAFKTAMVKAQRAFNAARKSATTKDARKAAEATFKTAVSTAKATKIAALKALSGAPKPVKP
ncbi:MAG: hypothetical protein ACYC06_11255 [Ilumatobacteraceae bacterium]